MIKFSLSLNRFGCYAVMLLTFMFADACLICFAFQIWNCLIILFLEGESLEISWRGCVSTAFHTKRMDFSKKDVFFWVFTVFFSAWAWHKKKKKDSSVSVDDTEHLVQGVWAGWYMAEACPSQHGRSDWTGAMHWTLPQHKRPPKAIFCDQRWHNSKQYNDQTETETEGDALNHLSTLALRLSSWTHDVGDV